MLQVNTEPTQSRLVTLMVIGRRIAEDEEEEDEEDEEQEEQEQEEYDYLCAPGVKLKRCGMWKKLEKMAGGLRANQSNIMCNQYYYSFIFHPFLKTVPTMYIHS